jgi:hypothetical protein
MKSAFSEYLKLTDANKRNIFAKMALQKAESLTINNVGQRPTKRKTHDNPSPNGA